ncbi:hypothetical protein CTI12_AA066030 [Artemisia annua]|uniref:RRM domain-containing protein n=1 Tax=Artemisia annua TaxID=35608 RepID=A0A2U1PPZ7_ARTAN|nr:hypothetical protein CTI12_AA066030 [Artemisia annua]
MNLSTKGETKGAFSNSLIGNHNDDDGWTSEEHQRNAAQNGQDKDGEWEKVTGKRRRPKNGSHQDDRRFNKFSQEGRRQISDFDRVMRDKATSFFFTNFPESWDSGALWKMFSRYGKVVDVYVAFKRTKRDTRFGFVRFINIGDISSFENRLKGIMIGAEKLIVNRGKFMKVDGQGVPKSKIPTSDFPPINPGPRPKSKFTPIGRSFREAVIGHKKNGLSPTVKSISLEEDGYLRSKLESCWVGKAKNFHVLQNAWDVIKNNGLTECKVKYVGGLSFLFEWDSKETAIKSLEENKIWVQQWFDDLKMWEDNGESYGRLTWIHIEDDAEGSENFEIDTLKSVSPIKDDTTCNKKQRKAARA